MYGGHGPGACLKISLYKSPFCVRYVRTRHVTRLHYYVTMLLVIRRFLKFATRGTSSHGHFSVKLCRMDSFLEIGFYQPLNFSTYMSFYKNKNVLQNLKYFFLFLETSAGSNLKILKTRTSNFPERSSPKSIVSQNYLDSYFERYQVYESSWYLRKYDF